MSTSTPSVPHFDRAPLPSWFKIRPPGGANYARLKGLMRGLGLTTVCEEARCPNLSECWGGGTATFMLMGDRCTRACRFCAVKTGNPEGRLDAGEPLRVAEAVAGLGLRYVVLTTVDRDDLDDGGALHFARTIERIKERDPAVLVEALTGDFGGATSAIDVVLLAGPDVFAHNLETVRRLTPRVRDRHSSYETSLAVLRHVRSRNARLVTKSSLMLGLGETIEEVLEAMDELREVGVKVLTVGQYLRPARRRRHLPVVRYASPEEFQYLADEGRRRGFSHVASGPLVRSSYRAGEYIEGGSAPLGPPGKIEGGSAPLGNLSSVVAARAARQGKEQ